MRERPGEAALLCDEARLLRDRPTGSRRSSAFRYRRWEEVFPAVDLAAVPENDAIEELVRRYVAAYGPVTVHDIGWWTGLPLRTIRAAIEALGGELVPVPLPGEADEYLMTDDDLARAEAAPVVQGGPPVLLPVLDPFLSGYRARDRFLDPAHRAFVYDPGGNATFTVLVDGRVRGGWDLAEGPRPAVRVMLFDADDPCRPAVLDRCAAVGGFWFGVPVPVEEYRSMAPLAGGRGAMHPLDGAVSR